MVLDFNWDRFIAHWGHPDCPSVSHGGGGELMGYGYGYEVSGRVLVDVA